MNPNNEPMPDAPADQPAPAAAEASAPHLEAQWAELEARQTELNDAYLRAKAEAENTRRRADEEMGKARKFAVEVLRRKPAAGEVTAWKRPS